MLFVLAGIAMPFWREYAGSPSQIPRGAALDLITQATLGPVYLGSVLFVVTVPVVVSLAALAYAGCRRRSLAPAALPFALLGGRIGSGWLSSSATAPLTEGGWIAAPVESDDA